MTHWQIRCWSLEVIAMYTKGQNTWEAVSASFPLQRLSSEVNRDVCHCALEIFPLPCLPIWRDGYRIPVSGTVWKAWGQLSLTHAAVLCSTHTPRKTTMAEVTKSSKVWFHSIESPLFTISAFGRHFYPKCLTNSTFVERQIYSFNKHSPVYCCRLLFWGPHGGPSSVLQGHWPL